MLPLVSFPRAATHRQGEELPALQGPSASSPPRHRRPGERAPAPPHATPPFSCSYTTPSWPAVPLHGATLLLPPAPKPPPLLRPLLCSLSHGAPPSLVSPAPATSSRSPLRAVREFLQLASPPLLAAPLCSGGQGRHGRAPAVPAPYYLVECCTLAVRLQPCPDPACPLPLVSCTSAADCMDAKIPFVLPRRGNQERPRTPSWILPSSPDA